MRVYRDHDADLGLLEGQEIAVIGFGNQGRAQALNLRDSGLNVVVGNRPDAYADRALEDGFPLVPIGDAVTRASIVMLLIPDEVAADVFSHDILPSLARGDTLVFASGYNITFGRIEPPKWLDVILLAPRMIGAGVRDRYVSGAGFPSFVGVAQDRSGRALDVALALAKGIGSTRFGAVQVTFDQETELDLFTEQCFGPAFGQVLMTAVNLLIDDGYPPEAVLLELYMSGELSYTLGKIAEMGMVEQSRLHSETSQYGSMSRGMRFMLPEVRAKMAEGLDDIRSGRFAQEWAAEQAAGQPTLKALREAARSLPLLELERELRQAVGMPSETQTPPPSRRVEPGAAERDVHSKSHDLKPSPTTKSVGAEPVTAHFRGHPRPGEERPQGSVTASTSDVAKEAGMALPGVLGRIKDRFRPTAEAQQTTRLLSGEETEEVLALFTTLASGDPALQEYSRDRVLTTHYLLNEPKLEFYLGFDHGRVTAGLGSPSADAEVRLRTNAGVLDGMMTGRINAMRAAVTGKLTFEGEARLAMGVQAIQEDLMRLYRQARLEITGDRG
jgi:ketol-acid reductoisomerase